MAITYRDISTYLHEVYEAIKKNRYQIERNENRVDNLKLFVDYIISEEDAREILLSLTPMDFSEIRNNMNPKFPNEKLYIFGKQVTLMERFGSEKKQVSLYIKINKLQDNYVIVVSFHEEKRPISYYFTRT